MQRPGQRPYNIRLALEQAGKTLTGQVVYPTGTAAIEEGVVNGTRLSFFTRHTPAVRDRAREDQLHGTSTWPGSGPDNYCARRRRSKGNGPEIRIAELFGDDRFGNFLSLRRELFLAQVANARVPAEERVVVALSA